MSAKRIGALVGCLTMVANMAGAVLAFWFLTFLVPDGTQGDFSSEDRVSFGVLVGYLIFTAGTGFYLGNRTFRRIGQWLDSGADPASPDRSYTLKTPVHLTKFSFFAWVGAAVLFVLLNVLFENDGGGILRIAIGVLLAGLTTCGATFLLTEKAMRPLVAIALAGSVPERERFLGVRPRLMLAWWLGSGLPAIGIALVTLSPQVRSLDDVKAPVLFLVAIALGAGWLLMFVSMRAVADPLKRLRTAVARVEGGDLDVRVDVDDGSDVGLLEAGFNNMVSGLQERRQLQELFGRHVGEEVARQALERQVLGGEQREATALFVDLVGSTQLAQSRSPAEVVRTLNAFFDAVVRTVGDQGGWVNKFEGDGALCVFGAPADQPDHAARALRAGRALRHALAELRSAFPNIDAGIGVSSGMVVAGNVGSEARYEYTVIGDPVNEAARLTEEAKAQPERLLASEATIELAASEGRAWRRIGEVELRGRTEPTCVYVP